MLHAFYATLCHCLCLAVANDLRGVLVDASIEDLGVDESPTPQSGLQKAESGHRAEHGAKMSSPWSSNFDLSHTAVDYLQDTTNQLKRNLAEFDDREFSVLDRQEPAKGIKLTKVARENNFRDMSNTLTSLGDNVKGVRNSAAVDSAKIAHRLQMILAGRDATENGNKQVSHDIHSLLLSQIDPRSTSHEQSRRIKASGTDWMPSYSRKTQEKWVGEQLDDEKGKGSVETKYHYDTYKKDHKFPYPHVSIVGKWRTSRGVKVDVRENGDLDWETLNFAHLRKNVKHDREKDKLIADPEGFEKSVIFLWHDPGKPAHPIPIHGHINTNEVWEGGDKIRANTITWLEDQDVWERIES